MELPQELLVAPPRDLLKARRLFAANRKGIQASLAGMILLPVLLVFLGRIMPNLTGYMIKGLDEVSSVWISAGLDVLIALFVLAFFVQMKRAERLFRDGRACIGKVLKVVSSSSDGSSKARYIFIDVSFQDGVGRIFQGKCSTTGTASGLTEGGEVALLHLPADPGKFAIYDPGLGMIPGAAKSAGAG